MIQPVMHDEALRRAADVVASLIQGEVFEVRDACVVIGEASAPLSDEASAQAIESEMDKGLIIVPHAVDEIVLLTQTCDLQQTTLDENRCLVAPLRKTTTQRAREALRGRRPGLAALPWVDSESVGDLSLITTVERSVLVGAARKGRPRNPLERLHFADTVARYLTRPALPDHINNVLKPFLRRIAERHDRDSPEGHCLSQVSELRLEAFPDIDGDAPALTVLVLIDEANLPVMPSGAQVDDDHIDDLVLQGIPAAAGAVLDAAEAVSKREAWSALTELWIQPAVEEAAGTDAVGSVAIAVINGEELSYARSRNAPVLDLRYLSTRAA
jgi:hypothetical protein